MTQANLSTPRSGNSRSYKAGIALVVMTSLLIVWTSIVRDDGSAAGYFMIILAAGVGGFATRFTPEGMARTMFGVAAMQSAMALLVATAPITASQPGGIPKALAFHAVFVALWLASAWCFRRT